MAGNEEHEGTGGATAGMLAHMKSAEKEENAINDALPTIRPQSELHIQMTLQDDTTFEDLRQKIEMYEQVSQRWMSDGGLQMNVKPLMDVEDRGGPMEVDAIWSKGGKKGGKKGKKGKDKGKSQKGLATMEIFDLTQDDSAEELETENDDENLAMAILAVREVENENEEETFYECQSEVEFEPPGTSSLESTGDHDLRHDPRAQYSDEEAMKVRVCMVRQEAPTIALTLDSGADVSVAPEEYYAMGMPGTSRSVSMMDAQGGAIKSSGNRRLRLQAYTRDGELIEFVEQFALGVGVSHPLLSFGRLLKQGWVLSRDQDGLYVEHPERKMKIPARLERNSLVMDVQVCAVRADDMDDEPLTVENEASKNDDVPKENAVTANDMAKPVDEEAENVEKSATGSIEGARHPDQAGGERGVKRAVDAEDGATLALMEELSEQKPHAAEDRAIEEAPTKKSKTAEMEAEELRSPGYTTEESGDVVVEASSSEDGKVKSRMARWANWKLRCGEVKSEPMELSDSPVVDVEVDENHVFPVREEGQSRQGYISRELALLEKVPGWHALPNGIVVHSSPQATHFLDPSMSFGDEWCARLTLLKKKDNSGLWEQIESLAVYRDTPLPFRAIPGGPRPALTFVAPGLIRDYFVWNSEVPVSQYPLLQGEPSSWPDDERDEEGGEFPMLAAGSGGRAEIAEDVQFVDPDEMRVQIDDVWFDKETKLKDLQDICKQLGLATSGSKIKVLRRLQRYKHQEEEKLAYEVAQRLFSESRREAVPLKTPKLPSRHEQELHQLTQRVADMAEEATGDEQVEKEAKTVGEQAMKGEPAGNFPPGAHELSPKRQRIEDVVGNLAPVTPPLLGKREYALPWDDEDDEKRRMSPKRRVRSIQEEFPGGDDMVAEEALQQQLNAVSDEEEEIDAVKGKPPVVSDDELARLDAEACKHEEARLEAMGVLERMKDGEEEVRITGIPTAVNPSDIGTKILSKARMNGLKYLIRMVDGDDEKIGKSEYDEIKLKEELKKNTTKMAKAMGANAKVALVIALSLLQGGKGAEVQESENEDQDDESWWMRPLITMLCLAMIGALSLARLVIDGARARWNGRRINEETIEEKQDESDRGQAVTPHVRNEDESGTLQPEEPWQAEDQEKVNMQWQIIQLEVAVAEQEEKMTEIRRDRDIQSREVVRMYDMCTNLRFELEKVKEERDNMMMKLTGSKDTDDEHAVEMARMAEDCARAWEAVELWKKRSKEILTQANEVVKEKLESTRFTLERKEWWMTRTGGCYHTHDCSHLAQSSNVRTDAAGAKQRPLCKSWSLVKKLMPMQAQKENGQGTDVCAPHSTRSWSLKVLHMLAMPAHPLRAPLNLQRLRHSAADAQIQDSWDPRDVMATREVDSEGLEAMNKEQKGKPETSGFVMYSHDGKRVELKGNAESGKRSGSSSASQSDGSIKEENQKLKDAIRRMLQAEKPEDADLDAVRTLIKVDPREEIRQRQRQLNQERRILNRAENLKETLHKKENSYQSWKRNMQEGLAQEDRRLSKELAELQAEIKAAEEKELNDAEMDGEPSDVDPTLVDVTRQVVQDELKEMKDQMGQFASYAAQMERQNQHLTEQVAMLLNTLHARSGDFIPKESPQHPHPRPSFARFEGAGVEEHKRTQKGYESIKIANDEIYTRGCQEDPVNHAEVKHLLTGVSEEAQRYFLQNMQNEPEKFPTMRAAAGTGTSMPSEMRASAVSPVPGGLPAGRRPDAPKGAKAKERFPSSVNRVSL
ncbi:unnamed protein product [Durusdinium trenchii]|uniref:SAP domain-containing protein n=1 Tax=Durusdinium trenchii TaxID=1381693 RepID=A0ABP0KKI0_9DINO